jgi:hypothetical protein
MLGIDTAETWIAIKAAEPGPAAALSTCVFLTLF